MSSRVCDENRQGRAGFEQVAMTAVKTRVEVAEGGESKRWGLAAFSVCFDVSAGSYRHFLAPCEVV